MNFTSTNEKLREYSVQSVLKEKPNLSVQNPIQFIKEVTKKFIEAQLDNFPFLCQVTRTQNYLKWKELEETSNKGKYTDSYGWSKDKTFKFDYEIPREMYLFMTNLVYKDFWEKANEKVWRKFMKKVCDGDDPEQILIWVKKIYGSNKQEGVVCNG